MKKFNTALLVCNFSIYKAVSICYNLTIYLRCNLCNRILILVMWQGVRIALPIFQRANV